MTIEIKCFELGALATNCYILSNKEKHCVIIDPAENCYEIIDYIEKQSLCPQAIILTHGHFDHIMGIPLVLQKYSLIDIWIHPLDKPYLSKPLLNASAVMGYNFSYNGPTRDLNETTQKIGGIDVTVIHIPGHTPGGCALLVEQKQKICICGDSLFAGSIGRYDFPGGDGELLVKKIKEKILTLDDSTVLYPGHGGRTTVGREKRLNPYLQ